MTDRHSILLVDDHPVLRQGLARLIEGEFDLRVCGEAATPDEAVTLAAEWTPELAIVDLSLGDRPGTDLIRRLRTQYPLMRVLVLSMHDEAVWAPRVLEAGACGYVMKQEDPRTLVTRIRQALRDETAVSNQTAATLLRQLTWDRPAAAAGKPDVRLGEREMEVLRHIGQGRSTREIAASMHISVKTVDAHREHIKRKLNLSSAAELIRYAVLRWVDGEQTGKS